MNATDKSALALPLSPPTPGEADAVMPPEFAGMYQAGFEAGYEQGRQAGYRQGLGEGIAAVQQGPINGAATNIAIEGKPAPNVVPQLNLNAKKSHAGGSARRMLLGMPCERCRVYLMSHETSCPCCKQVVRAA